MERSIKEDLLQQRRELVTERGSALREVKDLMSRVEKANVSFYKNFFRNAFKEVFLAGGFTFLGSGSSDSVKIALISIYLLRFMYKFSQFGVFITNPSESQQIIEEEDVRELFERSTDLERRIAALDAHLDPVSLQAQLSLAGEKEGGLSPEKVNAGLTLVDKKAQ